MAKLHIGIIGLGIGMQHFYAYKEHPDCDVTAVCDFSDDALNAFRRDYTDIHTTPDAREVLTDPEIDLVSIASFDNYHFDQTVTALTQNKHVFVEKPLCLKPDQATAIHQLMKSNTSLQLSSNLTLRTCPRFRDVKHDISSGQFGEVFYLEADYLWGRIHKLLNGWRKDMPFYSIVHGAAIHMIDLIHWLIQDVPVEVYASGNNIATRGSNFRFHDFAAILMNFRNGTIAKITANGGCVHPHFHKLIVYGTKQTFTHEWSGARLIHSCEKEKNSTDIDAEYPGRRRMDIIHSFVNSIIQKDAQALVPSRDVFNTLSVCFAAEESIRKKRPVTVTHIA